MSFDRILTRPGRRIQAPQPVDVREAELRQAEPTLASAPPPASSPPLAAPTVVIRVVDPYARLKLIWLATKIVGVICLVWSFLHSPWHTVRFLGWELPRFVAGWF